MGAKVASVLKGWRRGVHARTAQHTEDVGSDAHEDKMNLLVSLRFGSSPGAAELFTVHSLHVKEVASRSQLLSEIPLLTSSL